MSNTTPTTAPLRKPLVMTLRHGSSSTFPSYPQPEAGRKILNVSNDETRLYFDCAIDLMAVRGTYIPSGFTGNEFSFDAEMKLDDVLTLCLYPGHGQLANASAVYHKSDGIHTLWDRNGWFATHENPTGRTFWARDLGTHIPDTRSVRLVRVEKLVAGEWKRCRKVQVDPQAQFEFRPEA
jgi:hypothetical protein